MRIYISGKVTGKQGFEKDFAEAEAWLKLNGHEVVSPAKVCAALPATLAHEDYMQVCFRLIDISECIYVLKGWQSSKGAKAELSYAKALGKKVKFEDKQWSLKNSRKTEINNNNREGEEDL